MGAWVWAWVLTAGAYADHVPVLVVAKGTVALLRKVWESL